MKSDTTRDTAGIDPVGATSRTTAAARARESLRVDPLFVDPFAAALAGSEGQTALERHDEARAPGQAIANPTFAIRTRFFDEYLLSEATKHGVRQIILIAAGLDTRAFRLSWPPDVEVYELDQTEVLAYKDATLASLDAKPTSDRRVVPVDLRQPWVERLLDAGFERGRSAAWLAEGLTFYLNESAVRRLFTDIGTVASASDRLGADFVAVPPPGFDPLIQFMTDDPERLLADCGWTAKRFNYDVEGARLGRPWPYAGRPQGWMTIAHRSR